MEEHMEKNLTKDGKEQSRESVGGMEMEYE